MILKELLDKAIAIICLVLFSPILIIIALAIKLDSEGSILFKQVRLGKNGSAFTLYKFRTMIKDAESMGTGLYSYEDDYRVTRVGKFLRMSSLDELPQLINVLLGQMSVVGPRPPVSYELGNYEEFNDTLKKRFIVKPGITGLAQINGRNQLTWDEKIVYDTNYINLYTKWGILVDLRIILLTFIKIITFDGIIEDKREFNNKT